MSQMLQKVIAKKCYNPNMKNLLTRRVFIASTLISGTALMLLPQGAKTAIKIEPFKVIASVQEVLLPKNGDAPSASEFGATRYLAVVSTHSSFVPSDLQFLNEGAKKLMKQEPEFLSMSFEKQEKVVKEFYETRLGSRWLSLLLFYTLEALLSDPIYGGNKDEIGWKWLGHNSGQPQPKKPFGELV